MTTPPVPDALPDLLPLVFTFHVGTGRISNLIRWQQRAPLARPVSHVGILRPTDRRIIEAWQGDGTWAIVRRQGRVQDTRTLADVARTERVDLAALWLPPADYARALAFAQDQVGLPYDYRSLVGFLTRDDATADSSGDWFCSELAYATAEAGEVALFQHTAAWEVSPPLLARAPALDFTITREDVDAWAAAAQDAARWALAHGAIPLPRHDALRAALALGGG